MKKIFFFGAVLCSVLLLASCSSKDKEEPIVEQEVYDQKYTIELTTDNPVDLTMVLTSVASKIYQDGKLVAASIFNNDDTKERVEKSYKTVFTTKTKGSSFVYILRQATDKDTHVKVIVTLFQNGEEVGTFSEEYSLTGNNKTPSKQYVLPIMSE